MFSYEYSYVKGEHHGVWRIAPFDRHVCRKLNLSDGHASDFQ